MGGPITVTFGTEAAYPPFEDLVGGEIVGFDADVIAEISNRTNYDIKLQNAQFDAIIPSIQSGQFDGGISAFTITEDRKQQVAFTIPYYDNALLVGIRSDTSDITQPEHLEGRNVCTQVGTTSESWLRTNVGATNETLVLLNSFPQCAESLKRGDVDAMMIDRAAVRELISRSGGELKAAFEIPVDEQFGIAVKKGDTDLLNALNGALRSMKEDGTLQTIMDKWQV